MKTAWRRTFLEELARRPVRARKIWLLVRLDLLEREDLALMARANVGAGFGLESGDPDQVRRIRKVGRLSDYLDQMLRVAEWAFSRAARGRVIKLGDDAIARAVRDVPRERCVPLLALPDAHLDRALPLDDEGLASISAMHAYVATFRALELGPGDSIVDLGGGSGGPARTRHEPRDRCLPRRAGAVRPGGPRGGGRGHARARRARRRGVGRAPSSTSGIAPSGAHRGAAHAP